MIQAPQHVREGNSIVKLAQLEFKPYEVHKILLSVKNIEANKIMQEKRGIDTSTYIHEVDNYALRHSELGHRNDPFPIVKEDFAFIPDIIENPDMVKYSKKTKQGRDALIYLKAYNGTTYYIEEVRTGKKTFFMKTMYKDKTPSGASYAKS